MYDSVQVFAKALNNLDSLSTIQPMALSCDAAGSWPDGEKVLSYLKEVDHMGLSGEIRFDADGFRTDFQLDLMEKVQRKIKKDWDMEPRSWNQLHNDCFRNWDPNDRKTVWQSRKEELWCPGTQRNRCSA
eukprot:TRINITY_DN34602_c0_g1_i1.p1 TRINITY_DN34602_c0_g1~~TRINITY_DN34602_c0_g1_i1.p1  ORF type:complete len:130 (+),score=21.27 TRINITY_DN34602_c0_g1_i1:100-489(+)